MIGSMPSDVGYIYTEVDSSYDWLRLYWSRQFNESLYSQENKNRYDDLAQIKIARSKNYTQKQNLPHRNRNSWMRLVKQGE